MSKTVICAGHICLDITPVFDGKRRYQAIGDLLEPGKLIDTHGVSVHTGGSVANTGLAMKLMGCDVRLLGKVGDDAFGGIIRKILAGYGAGGLIVDPASESSYSVVLAVPGIDRIFLHDPGANDSFLPADIPWETLSDAALFHFGYPPLMKQMYLDGGENLRTIFRRARECGCATSLDLAAVDPQSEAGRADWSAILEKTLPYVDFFVPSFEELLWMLDRETWARLGEGGDDMTAALDLSRYAVPLAERCIAMGCGAVLIKCGLSGMYLQTAGRERLRKIGCRIALDTENWADKSVVQPCFEAETVRSATGAGDVSIAAFLTAVLRGEGPERCAALSAAEGAASVAGIDALSGILPLDECARRIYVGWKIRERL
ncbi:MAG: carbohydrate kinase family protein [Oscillospiraceae bacterium]|nr:carbohydrate kinase family protein [Oscillospiraceae bacterium]